MALTTRPQQAGIVLLSRPGAGKSTIRSQIFESSTSRAAVLRAPSATHLPSSAAGISTSVSSGESTTSQTTAIYDIDPTLSLLVLDVLPGEVPGAFGSDASDASVESGPRAGGASSGNEESEAWRRAGKREGPVRVRRDAWYEMCDVLVYVLELEPDEEGDLEELEEVIRTLHIARRKGRTPSRRSASSPTANPHVRPPDPTPGPHIAVLLHKQDLPPESRRPYLISTRTAQVRDIVQRYGFEGQTDVYATSVWEESIFSAWGGILSHVVPELQLYTTEAQRLAAGMRAVDTLVLDRRAWVVVRSLGAGGQAGKRTDGTAAEGGGKTGSRAAEKDEARTLRAARMSGILKRFCTSLETWSASRPSPSTAGSKDRVQTDPPHVASRFNAASAKQAGQVSDLGDGGAAARFARFKLQTPFFGALLAPLSDELAALFVLAPGRSSIERAREVVDEWLEEREAERTRRRGVEEGEEDSGDEDYDEMSDDDIEISDDGSYDYEGEEEEEEQEEEEDEGALTMRARRDDR